jgi:alcohol dehydrogenase class IV
MDHETVFTLEATPIKFGPGAAADAGWELRRLGVTRALLVTDPGVRSLGQPDRIRELIEREGIEVVVYDRARVEPTVDSFQDAADFALEAGVDGFVSVGGGSSIDTAKVANLITAHPAPVMDYVNPPVGGGRKPPAPLRPHLAIPTTSGTGSEATTVAVLDIPEQRVQERHLAPVPAPDAGDRRPGARPHAAARGHVVDRPGRHLPRGRVLPRAPLRPARAPGDP